jgi:hypothetical protein
VKTERRRHRHYSGSEGVSQEEYQDEEQDMQAADKPDGRRSG